MKHQDGSFKGIRGANISYQSWSPDSVLGGILLIVHGLAEHCGRYVNIEDNAASYCAGGQDENTHHYLAG